MDYKVPLFYRPGGELNTSEDQVEGLKRLLTEVNYILSWTIFMIKFDLRWAFYIYKFYNNGWKKNMNNVFLRLLYTFKFM